MKKNLTELVFILDRSGSMCGLESDTVGGFNAMLEKQKNAPGAALVSTVLFNGGSQVLHDRADIKRVAPLTEADYRVGGSTALYDAVGSAIHHIGNVHKYIRPADVPEHTVFVITTDGCENASSKYTAAGVKQMIERQKEKYGWEFIFLGANIDAVQAAGSIGINANRAATYRSDSKGTRLNYEVVSDTIELCRRDMPIDDGWKRKIEQYEEKNR